MNSKTQRPIAFSYQCWNVSGASIGIIEIPVQERPVYVTRTFGKVQRDTVYLRRGSSTAVVRPDEVAKMGRPMESWGSTNSPHLTLDWADVNSRGVLGSSCAVRSLILEPRLPNDTFVRGRSMISSVLDPTLNPEYIQEVIDYVTEHSFFRPLGLRIHNGSEVTGRRVRFVGAIGNLAGLRYGSTSRNNRGDIGICCTLQRVISRYVAQERSISVTRLERARRGGGSSISSLVI